MKLSIAWMLVGVGPVAAFVPLQTTRPSSSFSSSSIVLHGYLDDLNSPIFGDPPEEEEEMDDSRDATKLAADKVDRGGVGDWSQFVDFNEFDGGDGQMGVAGDGNKKLEKFDMSEMAKSKSMSAKNAWGKTTGYAEQLISQGVEAQRAQQLENWKNQQEVLQAQKQQKWMADEFDKVTQDDNQWSLGKFGVQRNQDFDLEQAFGPVVAGANVEGVIELKAFLNQNAAYEFHVQNEYMGFADFRAAFTPDTPPFWTIEPSEGSLDKKGTDFVLRFRPQSPNIVEGYLVIETEDFKKTWKLIGGTS